MVSLDGSGVSREAHAPFCERLGVRFPRPTRLMLREDACAVKRDHAPANLSIVRRLILNMLKLDTTHPKRSVRLRRKCAGWDDDERMRVLQIQAL